jgi:hypothetical protein
MKTTMGTALLCLCASMARADFVYLSQFGTATASIAAASTPPISSSTTWSEPSGFVDYSQIISQGPSTPFVFGVSEVSATFQATYLEIEGAVKGYLNGDRGATFKQAGGSQSRSVTFRNDTMQSWPVVGKIIEGQNATNSFGAQVVTSVSYSLIGSDGSDVELSPTPIVNGAETDFTDSIMPGVIYTVTINAGYTVFGPPIDSGGYSSFFLGIGTPVPEPPIIALAFGGMPVAILAMWLSRIGKQGAKVAFC